MAKYPQDSRGSVLVAEKILDSYQLGTKGKKVDVNGLAAINPDGDEYSRKINEVHRIFNTKYHSRIPTDITPEQAKVALTDLAIFSMDRIRSYSIDAATELKVQIPETLNNPVMKTERPAGETKVSPNWINKEVTSALNTFLNNNAEVVDLVARRLKREAEDIRNDSHNQQKFAASGNASANRF